MMGSGLIWMIGDSVPSVSSVDFGLSEPEETCGSRAVLLVLEYLLFVQEVHP